LMHFVAMNQAYFPPSFPPGPGKFHESSSSIVINSSPALSQGRPSVPVRVGAPPVSGRQGSQASGSSTPGTATSGRAGSTGRLVARSSAAPVVVQTRSTLDGKGNIRRPISVASSTWNGSTHQNGQPSGVSQRDAAPEELQPVRRARSAGRSGDGKDVKVSSARRDSPNRNVSPKGGLKPRRASPVKPGGAREISRSPEPPRARPPPEAQASPEGRTELPEPQPTSFVQSLARLALVLERNGQAGTGAAAAATAVAAVVAKQGDDGIGDIHQYLQADAEKPAGKAERAEVEQLRNSEEALRARCARLENELVELRVQLSRRMDQAALEVAASRQAAETAIAQVAALRAELASIIGQNGEEVKPKTVAEDHQARHWPQQLSNLMAQ